MTKEEIKEAYTLPDVLDRFGVTINRHGFCACIYHGERTASMKIYPDNTYYCFCCGKHGDQITAVMQLTGLPFQSACEALTGEKLTPSTRRSIAIAKMRREARAKREEALLADMHRVGDMIDVTRRFRDYCEPLSDDFWDAVECYSILCDLQDEILEEYYGHKHNKNTQSGTVIPAGYTA
ncbi:MAG: hypothetical protein IJP92_02670 [Lachnospiraceae bacterium]|nr:hypothetical protein [Lachnospiraceae bacterium]